MSTLKRRLDALEQRKQATQGIRIFQQDWEDEGIFHEGVDNQQGQPYTQAEINALGAQGWQCIVLEYVDMAIDQGAMNHILVADTEEE
jgi:hypothetical protein